MDFVLLVHCVIGVISGMTVGACMERDFRFWVGWIAFAVSIVNVSPIFK